MRHADFRTTLDYDVDQDADDVAGDFWREFGNGPEIWLLCDTTFPRAKKKPARRHKAGAGNGLTNREFRGPAELFVAAVAEWDGDVVRLVMAA